MGTENERSKATQRESDNRVGLRSGDIKRQGGKEEWRGGGKMRGRNLKREEANVKISSERQA